MQIFIMRHGEAELIADADELRHLTPRGKQQAKQTGDWLLQHHTDFDCVFVSPYVRAQETAEIVINTMPLSVTNKTLSFITPEDNAKDVHDFIDAICGVEGYQKILLVSHMPLVSYLVAELTSDNKMISFQTASIAQIEYSTDNMTGEFVQLVSPTI